MSTISADTTVSLPADRLAPRPAGGGWRIVAAKEFADHVRSIRFLVLVVLLALAGLAAVHAASGPIRDAADQASQAPSIFLLMFTLSPQRIPAFHEFLAILGPLLGIGFGFDAVNAERSQGTLSRLVAQPIHRDEIINGKFVAGLSAISIALAWVMVVVGAYGALKLGVGPTWSDLARAAAFFTVTVAYIGLWLAFAILCSIVSRRSSTAALATLALWLVVTLFAGLIAGVVADAVHSVDASSTVDQLLANARLELAIRRISPDQLYRDATGVLLNPARQTTGIVLGPEAGTLPSHLGLVDSLLLAWWQIVTLVAGAVVTFALAYWTFMRQEVRA